MTPNHPLSRRIASVRWNALDPNDERSALIVPREDLRALENTAAKLYEALAFMRSCEASGECGADHAIVLEALDMARR